MIFIREPDGTLRPRTRAEARAAGDAARAAAAAKAAAHKTRAAAAKAIKVRALRVAEKGARDAAKGLPARKRRRYRTPEEIAQAQAETRAKVYVIRTRHERQCFFKIGWCDGDPILRLSQLQVSSPTELVLAAWYVVPEGVAPREVERLAHMRLKDWKVRGEWFRGHQIIITQAIEAVIQKTVAQTVGRNAC